MKIYARTKANAGSTLREIEGAFFAAVASQAFQAFSGFFSAVVVEPVYVYVVDWNCRYQLEGWAACDGSSQNLAKALVEEV